MTEVYAITAKTKDGKLFIQLAENSDEAESIVNKICNEADHDIRGKFNIEKLSLGHPYILEGI